MGRISLPNLHPKGRILAMKICMLLSGLSYVGTYYRAFRWAKYLVSRGHEVTLMCTATDRRYRTTQRFDENVRVLESPSVMDGRYVMTRLSGLCGWSPFSVFSRIRELRLRKYDIVHTFEHHPNVAIPPLVIHPETYRVLISDNCDHFGEGGFREAQYSPYRLRKVYDRIGYPFRKYMDCLERKLRRRADAITVISRYLQQRALDMGINLKRIYLIPGSADIEGIKPEDRTTSRRRHGINNNSKVLAFLGGAQFDLDISLFAFNQILKKYPNGLFLIIGRKNDHVMRKAVALGISNRLIATGWVADKEITSWLGCADVCVLAVRDHPVNHARWPDKVGSYMAAGRPTVCTRVGDVAEFIESNQVGLVSDPTPNDMADCIEKILSNSDLARAMGENARKAAEKVLSISIHGKILEDLYANLLKRRKE